jgi:hypothetical protein
VEVPNGVLIVAVWATFHLISEGIKVYLSTDRVWLVSRAKTKLVTGRDGIPKARNTVKIQKEMKKLFLWICVLLILSKMFVLEVATAANTQHCPYLTDLDPLRK